MPELLTNMKELGFILAGIVGLIYTRALTAKCLPMLAAEFSLRRCDVAVDSLLSFGVFWEVARPQAGACISCQW